MPGCAENKGDMSRPRSSSCVCRLKSAIHQIKSLRYEVRHGFPRLLMGEVLLVFD
jgi:hypothetical protein